jgi:peroxiredoxin
MTWCVSPNITIILSPSKQLININMFLRICILLSILPALSYCQTVKVKIILKEMPDSILYYLKDDNIVDSAYSKNGVLNFSFAKKDEQPKQYRIQSKVKSPGYDIYIERDSAMFDGTYTSDAILTAFNSQTHNDYRDYVNLIRGNTEALDRLSTVKGNKLNINSLNKVIKLDNINFVQHHPQSLISSRIILTELQRGNFSKREAQMLYNQLSKQQQATIEGSYVQDAIKLLNFPKIGDVAPLFTMSDVSGETIALKSFRGKTVVLNFWASWCPTSDWEMSKLITLYNETKNDNLVFIGINVDTDSTQLSNARTKYNIPWPTIANLRGLADKIALQYGIIGVPSHVVIDSKGKIVGMPSPIWDLEKELKSLTATHSNSGL